MIQLQYVFVERNMLGWPNSVDANGDDNNSNVLEQTCLLLNKIHQ